MFLDYGGDFIPLYDAHLHQYDLCSQGNPPERNFCPQKYLTDREK